jgi:predicted RND superfamily exporter protein
MTLCSESLYTSFDRVRDGLILIVLCVVADFFFAGFPWLFILGLQMKMKEKMVILLSLSLGVM